MCGHAEPCNWILGFTHVCGLGVRGLRILRFVVLAVRFSLNPTPFSGVGWHSEFRLQWLLGLRSLLAVQELRVQGCTVFRAYRCWSTQVQTKDPDLQPLFTIVHNHSCNVRNERNCTLRQFTHMSAFLRVDTLMKHLVASSSRFLRVQVPRASFVLRGPHK